jgi:hypothetical protein
MEKKLNLRLIGRFIRLLRSVRRGLRRLLRSIKLKLRGK